VGTFYENLKYLYDTHNYASHHIWNCDESGAQARKDGGCCVLARKGSRAIYRITPDQRERITVLSFVNARGDTIPNFFIFKVKRRARNYIRKIGERGAAMAMQAKS